ncbi:hypothetical protein ACFW2D_04715 [Streptomyces sp. NPDC058914]|uniref:hypothetical protein n=1 Tax=Streptomyces sp. NPDC058914 TaxID=3346671 RepID=UPI0036BAC95B
MCHGAVELGRLVVVAACDADSVESMTGLLRALQPPGDEALPPLGGRASSMSGSGRRDRRRRRAATG